MGATGLDWLYAPFTREDHLLKRTTISRFFGDGVPKPWRVRWLFSSSFLSSGTRPAEVHHYKLVTSSRGADFATEKRIAFSSPTCGFLIGARLRFRSGAASWQQAWAACSPWG